MNDQLTVAEQPQIKKFNHEIFGELEVLVKDGKEYLPATDVATTLEYAIPRKAVLDHCDEEGVLTWNVPTNGGKQQKKFITIGNVSRLIIAASKQSKNPLIKEKAKQYERWIFDEVIPSIHKHGGYIHAKENDTDDDILSKAVLIAQKKISDRDELIRKQNQQLIQQESLVTFAKAVEVSTSVISVKQLSNQLKQKGIDIGQNRLFEWLRENGYLCKRKGDMYNTPTQYSMDLGLFESQEYIRTNSKGEFETKYTPKVTGKGQLYFINKFLGKNQSA
ncbi:phage repressor protein/antirepressor Ant [Bacillus cereus]|uniref:Phage repressor protein/antirepressor Ant n=1 Tax=Bacillus cereus TaxID=1396 RepID=A0A9X7GY74_BACCE|nr:phage antirepressor KilAC domain-containing protein [Bacillus cereus]PGS83983.1 phage repressor protein/antirepressor Ant [Bacillus cereus]